MYSYVLKGSKIRNKMTKH